MSLVFRLIALVLLTVGMAMTDMAGATRQDRPAAATFDVAQSPLPNWADGLVGGKTNAEQKEGETAKPPQEEPQQATGSTDAKPAEAAKDATSETAGNGEQKPANGQAAAADEAPLVLPEQLEEVVKPVRRIANQLEDLEKTVDRVKDRDEELARARLEIEKLPPAARAAVEAIGPRLADLKAQIDKLGPGPKADVGSEVAAITAERTRLQKIAGALESAIKGAELLAVKAQQLVERVQDMRQQIFTEQVLTPTKSSPVEPAVWMQVFSELPGAGAEIVAIGKRWWARASSKLLELVGILVLTVATYLGFRILRGRLLAARLARPEGAAAPAFFERAMVAAWVAPTLILPGLAALMILYFGLRGSDLIYLQTERIAGTIYQAALIAIIVFGLSAAILQPDRGMWRLMNLSGVSARRLNRLIQLAVIVYGLDLVLRDTIKMLFLPFHVSIAQAFLFSLVFAGLLVALGRTPLQPRSPEATFSDDADEEMEVAGVSWWRPLWLKIPIALLALFIVGAALTGYVALARLTAAQVLLTGTVVVVIVLFHLAIRAIAGDTTVEGEEAAEGAGPAGVLTRRLGLQADKGRQMDRVIYFALNGLLALVAFPILLATWGFSRPEIIAFARSAVFGFDIGGIYISPTRIFMAVALFVGLLFATRLVQRWLKSTLLHPSRIDTGLANSIYTGVGYAGFAVAALAAVSYSGFDITNLAIVAGALSVGIGFGLQSIVNNFVSGLILLVERPIKVGDWISVGAFEGHVRRISVRSTEIETFNRSSVIVPNSELISGTVTNRTHRNALGRVEVAVGVSYDSDPEMVKDLLEKVTLESPLVLKFPAPLVSFDNFGASSLDFTIRAYLADVNKSVSTATDLRLRLFKALQQAGIEIPFPQQDVHLRDLDFVKATVARIAAERAANAAKPAGSSSGGKDGGEPGGGSGVRMDDGGPAGKVGA